MNSNWNSTKEHTANKDILSCKLHPFHLSPTNVKARQSRIRSARRSISCLAANRRRCVSSTTAMSLLRHATNKRNLDRSARNCGTSGNGKTRIHSRQATSAPTRRGRTSWSWACSRKRVCWT